MTIKPVNLRIRHQDKGILRQAAEIEGKTLSTFIRDCAYAAAYKVLSVPKLVPPPTGSETERE